MLKHSNAKMTLPLSITTKQEVHAVARQGAVCFQVYAFEFLPDLHSSRVGRTNMEM